MSKTYQRKSDLKFIFHHGLIHMLLQHELLKYHISWDRFLSKIQLDDNKHLRNYSIDHEKDPLPSDSKTNDRNPSDQPQNSIELPENREQSGPDFPDQSKIDVSFVNKENARLSSRLTRNQTRKKKEPEQRYNISDIIINSEGKSTSNSKEN